jgi:hypothetical protein
MFYNKTTIINHFTLLKFYFYHSLKKKSLNHMPIIHVDVLVCGNGLKENSGSCFVGDVLVPIFDLDNYIHDYANPGNIL